METLGKKKYYLATMRAADGESESRIRRHRRMRRGKGFLTIEQPVDIREAAEKMGHEERAVLVECIGNLTANEMFAGQEPAAADMVTEKIVSDIVGLAEDVTHLVVVSNNVFEDGRVYDDTTMAYLCAMGKINERLAAMADEVVEVVAGIPLAVKGRLKGLEDSCVF